MKGMPDHAYSEVSSLAKKPYHANPPFRVQREQCALLVIDMQDEFVKPGWTPFWVPEATKRAPRVRRLVEF